METIVISTLFVLILGAYGYTWHDGREKASKEDIYDLRDRVNLLYEHLLNKSLDEEIKKKRRNDVFYK